MCSSSIVGMGEGGSGMLNAEQPAGLLIISVLNGA